MYVRCFYDSSNTDDKFAPGKIVDFRSIDFFEHDLAALLMCCRNDKNDIFDINWLDSKSFVSAKKILARWGEEMTPELCRAVKLDMDFLKKHGVRRKHLEKFVGDDWRLKIGDDGAVPPRSAGTDLSI